jgi:hypothetical protein
MKEIPERCFVQVESRFDLSPYCIDPLVCATEIIAGEEIILEDENNKTSLPF